jgi:hypothetical protein
MEGFEFYPQWAEPSQPLTPNAPAACPMGCQWSQQLIHLTKAGCCALGTSMAYQMAVWRHGEETRSFRAVRDRVPKGGGEVEGLLC